jgi:hypothetical protein
VNSSVLAQIEESFTRLSRTDQLRLLERLVHYLHEATIREQEFESDQLAAMAADPEVQQELKRIEEEFIFAEADGLETA